MKNKLFLYLLTSIIQFIGLALLVNISTLTDIQLIGALLLFSTNLIDIYIARLNNDK